MLFRSPVVANMVKQALGHKFHWAVADYLQRSARHIASAKFTGSSFLRLAMVRPFHVATM